MEPFARTIDAAKKYVVSSTLDRVDWNAELVRGDLGEAVQQLKREPGKGLFVGGVKLPLALAELGLIDEYEFVVHPRLAGHGPTLFAGLSKHVDLKLVSRLEFGSGAVAMRYEPRRSRSMRAWKSDFHQPIKLNLRHQAPWETLVSNRARDAPRRDRWHHPPASWYLDVAGERVLLLTRDPLDTSQFRPLLSSAGVTPIRLPGSSPKLNACTERFVRGVILRETRRGRQRPARPRRRPLHVYLGRDEHRRPHCPRLPIQPRTTRRRGHDISNALATCSHPHSFGSPEGIAAGSIHTAPQMWPSGSAMSRLYMKP